MTLPPISIPTDQALALSTMPWPCRTMDDPLKQTVIDPLKKAVVEP